jgi:hypothetical protein
MTDKWIDPEELAAELRYAADFWEVGMATAKLLRRAADALSRPEPVGECIGPPVWPDKNEPVGDDVREVERLQHLLRLRDRQLLQSNTFWVRAAKEALAGDTRSLKLRVDMAEAPHAELIQSVADSRTEPVGDDVREELARALRDQWVRAFGSIAGLDDEDVANEIGAPLRTHEAWFDYADAILPIIARIRAQDNNKPEPVGDDVRELVNRLRGIYTIPVNDGAGLLDGKDTFTREFKTPPIQKEAADTIERLARIRAQDASKP